jgi:hypothetical protein
MTMSSSPPPRSSPVKGEEKKGCPAACRGEIHCGRLADIQKVKIIIERFSADELASIIEALLRNMFD